MALALGLAAGCDGNPQRSSSPAAHVDGGDGSVDSRSRAGEAQAEAAQASDPGKAPAGANAAPSAGESSPDASAASSADSADSSEYYSPREQGIKEITKERVRWIDGDVVFTARQSAQGIGKITAVKGEQAAVLPSVRYNQQPVSVDSVALSPSRRYLAVSLFYRNIGSALAVVDLEKGTHFWLNDTLDKLDYSGVETIQAYNWSPVRDEFVFSFGNTDSSRLAVYRMDDSTVTRLPSGQVYIGTSFILWSRDGQTLDYISEWPSDQFKLYRYRLGGGTAEEIGSVARADLSRYEAFVPVYMSKQ